MKVKKDVRSKRLRGLVKLCVKKDLADKSSIRTTIWRTMEKYHLLPNDALIVATCKYYWIRKLASFDEDFKRVEFLEIKV